MRLLIAITPSALLAIAACVGTDPSPAVESNDDAGADGVAIGDSASVVDGSNSGPDGDASNDDGPVNTGPCDLTKPFGTPTKLTDVSTADTDEYPRFASDGEELFVSRTVVVGANQAGGIVRFLKVDGGAWGPATTLALNDIGDGGLMHSGGLTTTANEQTGFFSRTDKFSFNRGISKITRSGPKAAWSSPTHIVVSDPAGQPAAAMSPWINADATRLYYEATSGASQKLYQAAYNAGAYGPAKLIGSDGDDRNPVLSQDEKRIYFASARPHPTGVNGLLVYTATRASIDDAFGPAAFVTELNVDMMEMKPTWLSQDGCTLVLSGRANTSTTYTDVYLAKKP